MSKHLNTRWGIVISTPAFNKMKLRKNNRRLEKLEIETRRTICNSAIDYYISLIEEGAIEDVNEIDCRNIYIQGGLASCTKLAFILNQQPCLPSCPYHKKLNLYGNRECYDGV